MSFIKALTFSLTILIVIKTIQTDEGNIGEWFEKINNDYIQLKNRAAEITWAYSVDPEGEPELVEKAVNYWREKRQWQTETCDKMADLQNGHLLNKTQRRMSYLLCRGSYSTYEETRLNSRISTVLQYNYNHVKVCIPKTNKNYSKANLTEKEDAIIEYLSTVDENLNVEHHFDTEELARHVSYDMIEQNDSLCLKGEADIEQLFKFSRNEKVLRWLWLVWKVGVGRTMEEPYRKLVYLKNIASRRKGYSDIGDEWRDELETPNLRLLCRQLYNAVKPLYRLLHGVVRFYLRKHYGDIVPERGPIPAHLLGNPWAENWQSLVDLITSTDIDLDKSMLKMNWTVNHIVTRAEDFYKSLGLPSMTETFWKKSVFSRQSKHTMCHGTSGDMFRKDDFRLLYCSGTTGYDFYVMHHELGHIHYFMAYENQPGIFRQGANSAFHESIGDSIMYGVLSPQHLNRLGLVNDSILYTTKQYGNEDDSDDETNFEIETQPEDEITDRNNASDNENSNLTCKTEELNAKHAKTIHEEVTFTSDDVLLLKQALNKLPQIPFALVIEEYRWEYFEGGIKDDFANGRFWEKSLELQGIAPITDRSEIYFDGAAKLHVPDNTYVSYFLASFLQHQLFEVLCKAAVLGRQGIKEDLPPTVAMHRCDIYGSKDAGLILKDIMSRGGSQLWQEMLQRTIGQDNISAEPLKRYYRPLYKVLRKLVRKHGIPIGW